MAPQVKDVMTGDPKTVSRDASLTTADHAVRLMRERAVRRLPVVDGGRLVGIVSIGDMAMEKDARSALSDISAAVPNT